MTPSQMSRLNEFSVDEISCQGKSCPIWFVLLGSNGAHEPAIGGIFEAVGGDVLLSDEEDGVGARRNTRAHALHEASEFVGGGAAPRGTVLGVPQ